MHLQKLFPAILSATILATAGLSQAASAQDNAHVQTLQLLGTRSWVRVNWNSDPQAKEYRLYWSADGKKPATPNAIMPATTTQYYLQQVQPTTRYQVWLEAVKKAGQGEWAQGVATTQKEWAQDAIEMKELTTNPSSAAVPKGMMLYWQDEFNDSLLNLNKWSTNYFSSLNYGNEDSRKEMLAGQLPQPAYRLNGKTIDLFVNDSLPVRLFTKGGNQKVSSIQTYDWQSNEMLLDNSRGGYFEVKVKRDSIGKPKGFNTAFWFDAPGPDIRYYLQEGGEVNGIKGIRPKGQVFEIDMFEYFNAQFVLHGHVDKNGKFQHNLATHIAEGYDHVGKWVTHGILWTPTSIKHYINGNLVKEYTDKHQVFSPNHFMNVFLGAYGSGGTVSMEVDYIRYYQWPLQEGNELPNPGFEDSGSLAPWEGNGSLVAGRGRNGSNGITLNPGQKIEQYVYVDNNTSYRLEYWLQGEGTIKAGVDNVAMVTGELSPIATAAASAKKNFTRQAIDFKSGLEYGHNKKTIRVVLENTGNTPAILDDITIKK
ncbi:fibronectin type III domain-containing protein [Chitinophaga eiseniae]|uniref:Family 16 glycosylhydrolase n=1 Tax=Chitinophaga eiseniae TaxID=634771 RepID=A0A847SR96_9BACT|nr:family 16 glycosylhydrolase [Chitinophaga eiseniae]NLR79859.1 family 16 glycosylhydrolase [Chitinophaga eiseniae]